MFSRIITLTFCPRLTSTCDFQPLPDLEMLLSLKGLIHLSGPALLNLSPEDPRTPALDLLVKNLPRLLFVRASFGMPKYTSWLKIARTYCPSQKATCTTAEVQFIPTDPHEYPEELEHWRCAYFKGYDPSQRWRSYFWT
ncbi:MAG TPA: hypothetical protein VGO47_03560 [Chlamydiales bacterium]|jgi:hypothetical protein|nr:hypothetical protein [Chlamydiales bacterium]